MPNIVTDIINAGMILKIVKDKSGHKSFKVSELITEYPIQKTPDEADFNRGDLTTIECSGEEMNIILGLTALPAEHRFRLDKLGLKDLTLDVFVPESKE